MQTLFRFCWFRKASLQFGLAAAVLAIHGVALAQAADAAVSGSAAQGPVRMRQPSSQLYVRDTDCNNVYFSSVANVGRSGATQDQPTQQGVGGLGNSGNQGFDNQEQDGYNDGQVRGGVSGQARDRTFTRNSEGVAIGDDRFLFKESVDTFEAYLRKKGMNGVRRFGAEIMLPRSRQECLEGSTVVPPDYILAPGDELSISLWGSVDGELRLLVDRTGRINVPRIGPIMIAGVPYGEVPALITRRAEKVFKNFQVSVSLGQLRSVRIYVAGHVRRPGTYTVNSLTTIVNALTKAGGPSTSGSFRNIQLRRARQPAVGLDFYDLLIRGDLSSDRLIQADDVIYVGPVGPQVALTGAVNRAAIFELKSGETLKDVMEMAGGMNAVADRSRLAVERLIDRNGSKVNQIPLPDSLNLLPGNGDVFHVFSVVDTILPVAQQNKRIRIEGEVLRPGEYVLPAATSMEDAVKLAGGLTSAAYLFGAEFSRESVRISQQDNYERAVRDLETEFARSSTQRALNADEAAAQGARVASTQRLIERMRAIKPTGRIVLQMSTTTPQLPNLALEDGDRIYIPSRPTSVGVFGSVFNGGSYLYGQARFIGDFLSLAGGPTRGADASSTFVLRANGSVVSNFQRTMFFGTGGIRAELAEPGDTIFVPEETNKTTWTQILKEWTQIVSQFGLGAAAIKALGY